MISGEGKEGGLSVPAKEAGGSGAIPPIEMTIVTSRLTGDFSGSPVNLRYFLNPGGNKIALLEISP
jgi:hypothetical protein